MTIAERDKAVSYLERTKAALLQATASITEAQWQFKPSPGQWSAAECVEHIVVSEQLLLDNIQKSATNPPDPAEVLAACAGKEKIIEQRVPRRGAKAKAPAPVFPSGRFGDPAAITARFIAVRDRTIEYARTTSDPIREHTFPHFAFGPLDGYQWLIFCAAHTERHTAQLLEVIEAEALARRTATGL